MAEYVNVARSPIFHKFRDDISVVSEQPNSEWLFRTAEINSFIQNKQSNFLHKILWP